MSGECPLFEEEIDIYTSEFWETNGCDRETLERWDCERKATAVRGDRNCPRKARVEGNKGVDKNDIEPHLTT